jgi:hypothetical protein
VHELISRCAPQLKGHDDFPFALEHVYRLLRLHPSVFGEWDNQRCVWRFKEEFTPVIDAALERAELGYDYTPNLQQGIWNKVAAHPIEEWKQLGLCQSYLTPTDMVSYTKAHVAEPLRRKNAALRCTDMLVPFMVGDKVLSVDL